MSLRNFKGVRNFDADLSGNSANIHATNGIGKTTVFDAFTWLLFGKDSRDRKDFEVKSLDKNNQPIHKLEHSVEVKLDIDGIHTTLRRVYKEKWVKTRGAVESELQGHTTDYYWNDVPLSQKEFQDKVGAIVDEQKFKLLSNPLFFNEVMKWQDRRTVITQIAGHVSDVDVLETISTDKNAHRIKAIEQVLQQGKKLEEYKAEISAKKKRLKENLAAIPARMDEVDRSKPEVLDWRNNEESLKVTTHQIQLLQKQLADSSAADREHREKVDTLLRKQDGLKLELRKISHRVSEENLDASNKANAELQAQQRVLANAENRLYNIQRHIADCEREIGSYEKLTVAKRNEWQARNAEQLVMEEGLDTCPTCKQLLPAAEIEEKKGELLANFNIRKNADLAKIKAAGVEYAAKLDEYKKKLADLQQDLPMLTALVDEAKRVLEALQQAITGTGVEPKKAEEQPDYIATQAEIAKLQAEIDALQQSCAADTSSITAEIAKFNAAADEMKAKLAKKDELTRCEARLQELADQEKAWGQELADLEADEYTMELFERSKMDMVEQKVNSLFEKARFKMFNQLLNGGYEPTCELLYDGVPWSNLNRAATIQLGLDCIKTLARFYGANCPIFIDNAESIVTNLPDMNGAQLIRLVADAEYSELTIKNV